MRGLAIVLQIVLLLAWAGWSAAFEVTNFRLVDGVLEMQADISHPTHGSVSASGVPWNTAFAEAGAEWNLAAGDLVDIRVNTGVYEDPCGPPPETGEIGLHGVDFGPDWCDAAFGMAVAVARTYFTPAGLLLHANIVFNENSDFDVFTGPLTGSRVDLRRVAVHEIGHVLGLGHSSEPSAIMAPITSSVEEPRADDIAGVSFVYDLGCPQYSSSTGAPISGTLELSDCFDTEVGLPLPVVGTNPEPLPDTFVDLYRVEATGAPLSFTLSSTGGEEGGFNPVLMLMNEALSAELVSVFGSETSTTLNVPRFPANYALVVRGIFEGSGGAYTLTGVPAVPEPSEAVLAVAALVTLACVRRATGGAGGSGTIAAQRRPGPRGKGRRP